MLGNAISNPQYIILIGMGQTIVKRIPLVAALFLFVPGFCEAQSIVGDWLGTIQLASVELRVQLHIVRQSTGGYTATLDDIDHGQNGIAASSISFTDGRLNLVSEALSASYEGRMNGDGTTMDGTWSQGLVIPLTFRRLKAPLKLSHKPAKPSDIDGTWEGVIGATNGARVVFHLVNTEDGLTATVDSPDQNLSGWPVPVVTRNDSTLKLELKQVTAVFTGKINSDRDTINGSWDTPGKQWPLVLKRIKGPR